MDQRNAVLKLWRGAAAIFLLAAGLTAQTPDEITSLLDGISGRLKSYADYKNWTASAVTTITEMNKDWNPQKITVITRSVRVKNDEREDDILQVIETEKGRTRDITKKYQDELRERLEKARKRRTESGKRDGGDGRDRVTINLEEVLPFGEKTRSGYDFRLPGGEASSGGRFILLEAKARKPNPKLWNGIYTIDPGTFDILRAEVYPSKNPKFVKEMEMSAEVEILDGKYFALKKVRFRVYGGIFLKRVRMVVEEEYSDVRITEDPVS